MTFPNLQPDNISKLFVYIGLSLLVVSGYIYVDISNRSDIMNIEINLAEKKSIDTEVNVAYLKKKQERLLAEIGLLDVMYRNPGTKFRDIINNNNDTVVTEKPIMPMLISIESSKNQGQFIKDLLIEKNLQLDILADSASLNEAKMKKDISDLNLLKDKLNSNKLKSNFYLIFSLISLVFILYGLIGWRKYDQQNFKHMELQMRIHELTIIKMEKEIAEKPVEAKASAES